MTELERQAQQLLKVLEMDQVEARLAGVIPPKVLENHTAILGITGSGKTYCAKGIAESLLFQKKRVCIIDPTGVWWGLRSDVTGKKPAFPIFVFGGEHGDIPLDSHAGKAIAEIIGTTDTSAVLDMRNMTVGERTRFFTDFAETLPRHNNSPLHLIIDEAHRFMPQGRVNDPQSGKMVNAGNDLLSGGRTAGLRIIMITQRPAKLHKDSLTCAETLIALRLIAPQDVEAAKDWIGEWADPKEAKDLIRSLPSLTTGHGWIWAPVLGLLEKTTFPRISTYDSSKAPDGASRQVVLAPINLPTWAKCERENMNLYGNVVTEDDTRSGNGGRGIPSKCFYCKGKRGGEHEPSCVCLKKPIKIRVTMELIDARPRVIRMMEMSVDEVSQLADNLIAVMQRDMGPDDDSCLCGRTTIEYLGDATKEEADDAFLTEE